MKSREILYGILFFLFCVSAYGQRASLGRASLEETGKRNAIGNSGNGKNTSVGNQVYIEQVGQGNFASSRINANRGRVFYRQDGDFNYINMNVRSGTLEKSVVQEGNHNRAFGFMTGASEGMGLQLSQEGNNHHFEQFGSNSIGDNMKLKMSGNSNSVIVRNFK